MSVSTFCCLLAVSGSAPLLSWLAQAETGVQDLTCGQFRSGDDAAREKTAAELLQWIACDDTCVLVGSLQSLLYGMTAQEVRQLIQDRCLGQPAPTNIVTRLKETL